MHFLKEDVTIEYIRKLQEEAELTLEGSDHIVQKHSVYHMILFGSPSKTQIQQYLKYLHNTSDLETSLSKYAIDGQKAIHLVKEKKFVLVTHQSLLAMSEMWHRTTDLVLWFKIQKSALKA